MKSVIELVKTSQGYSVFEDGHEVNKNSTKTKQRSFNVAPKKFAQQNFTLYPYLYCRQPEYTQKYLILPAKSQWFNINQIHQIEKKALPEWFKTKKVVFGAAKPDKFQKNEQLYKRYRNYIIDLARNQYVSPTAARKGLAGDVCAIIRIHSFLEKNGIINYIYQKREKQQIKNIRANESLEVSLTKRKDCIDKEKSLFEKHFDKDYLELLKKITRKYRPLCHLCEGICGVIWYQYAEQLCLKSFQKQTINEECIRQQLIQQRKLDQNVLQKGKQQKIKIVKSQGTFTYQLRLCSFCYTSGNLPVVLSHEDFKKNTVVDSLTYQYQQPRDKKKINEQNKFIELLQKNKFSLKKTSENMRISEYQLFTILMCIPLLKIQKLARIDPDQQGAEDRLNQKEPLVQENLLNGVSHSKNPQQEYQILLKKFEKQYQSIDIEQKKIYQELLQYWILKITAKLNKLSEWEKSTNWFSSKLIHDEKNSLAQTLKNKVRNL